MSVSLRPEYDEQRDFRRAAILSERLIDAIQTAISDRTKKQVRLSLVNNNIITYLCVDGAASRSAISNLVDKGHFHYVNEAGTRYLATGPAVAVSTEKAAIQATKAAERENNKIWTKYDVENATTVITSLLELRDIRQGIVIKELMTSERIVDRDKMENLRDSLKRMQKLGYIYIDQKSIPKTAPTHSGRFYYSKIKFKNRLIRTKAKTNFSGFVDEMNSRVGLNVDSI